MSCTIVLDGTVGITVQEDMAQLKVLLKTTDDEAYIDLTDDQGDSFLVRRDIIYLVTPPQLP